MAANNKRVYVAKGWRYKKPDSMVKSVILLDPETFSTIRSRALKHGTSFAEQVRLLIEVGLEEFDGENL
jgi:hypothetical protein